MAEDLQILKSQLAALRAKPSLSVGENIAAYNLENKNLVLYRGVKIKIYGRHR
jgi:hypothetical protein